MRVFLLLLSIITGNVCWGTPPIGEIRLLHQQAATSEKHCRKLINILDNYNENNEPILAGYKASATMMMAKFAFNPFSKLSYFKKGKKMLETAIESRPENIELRFLRFAIQTNVPAFLGYDDQVEADKAFLLARAPGLTDVALKKIIVDYLLNSGKITAAQKTKL